MVDFIRSNYSFPQSYKVENNRFAIRLPKTFFWTDSALTTSGGHLKARTEKPDEYPERQVVADRFVSWDVDFPEYNPTYYVSPVVLKNDSTTKKDGWADPEDFNKVRGKNFDGLVTTARFDEDGRPLNPIGRTGLSGRGLLGKWGPNFAADPIVTRINPITQELELLVILRTDCDQWALPGGMVDKGELVTKTLSRELKEETNLDVDFASGKEIYKGYVDDRRNTDHAWMETTATHIHLPKIAASQAPQAGDDAKKAMWVKVDPSLKLYASHEDFIRTAIKGFDRRGLPQVAQNQIAKFL